MRQAVIAVTGVSGVGKSFLLRKAKGHLEFQHLQASQIIRDQKLSAGKSSVDDQALRAADLDESQAMLIRGFHRVRDPAASIVVLDAHTVIDAPTGLVDIRAEVFREIGVSRLLFIADSPSAIVERRQSDCTRSRPARSERDILAYQGRAQAQAFAVALQLRVPCSILTPEHHAELESLLRKEEDGPAGQGEGR